MARICPSRLGGKAAAAKKTAMAGTRYICGLGTVRDRQQQKTLLVPMALTN